MNGTPSTPELTAEMNDLRARLAEAEEALRAIRNGELDAVVVDGEHGERRVYTLSGADRIYRQLIETMSEGAATLSADRVILYCNARLAQMLGRPLDHVLGTDLRDYLPTADQAALDAVLAQVHPAPIRREINLKASDGRLVPVYLSASRLPVDETELVFCLVLTDLTEQKSHEQIVAAAQHIRKLNRVYVMLSNVNQAIVRIRHPQALLEEVCRIAVEDGGFRMAWIGLVDPVSRRVLQAAHAGVTDGYLETLNIVMGDDARASGPTGSAVRTGIRAVCRDIENDPCMLPWREDALRNGYRSSAAFPLKASDDEVRGAFSLYAVEIDFFDDDETKLLDELTTNIGFAMEFAEQESERKRAEAALTEQLDELRRWHAVTLGREGRIGALKHEVNALATRLGQPPPYNTPENGERERAG